MRLMGIDYGSKKVGIAVSDEAGQFAMPHVVIKNSKHLYEEVLKEVIDTIEKNKIKEIVMGESKDFNGKGNTILPESLNFKMDLEKAGFTVYLEPEFMTSQNAERFQGKNDMLDASAAALILQSFLDKRGLKE